MATIGKDIAHAAELLRKGQVVAIPTETVYGLAGNALNLAAVTEIFKAKQRPFFDPLIVHLSEWERAQLYVTFIGPLVSQLAQQFMPGPLTVLVEKKSIIPDLVTSGSKTVALRVPNHPMAQELLCQLDFPLAAPSANLFSKISPTRPLHVKKQLGDRIPYILDGGICRIGVESTIIAEEDGRIVVYRPGGISVELIAQALNHTVEVVMASKIASIFPGTLKHHYAPEKNMELYASRQVLEKAIDSGVDKNVCIICFGNNRYKALSRYPILNLSRAGSLDEAATNLFNTLHQAEALQTDSILVEMVPNEGIGKAINDRLTRGARLFHT